MNSSFADNNYVIDLSYAKTPADIIYEFSSILENDSVKNKKIFLKIGEVDLNQSQLLSIKSLINSLNSQLNLLEAKSIQTQQAALNLGIVLANVNKEVLNISSEQGQEKQVEDNLELKLENCLESSDENISSQGDIKIDNSTVDDVELVECSAEELNYTIAQTQKMKDELDIIFDEERKLEEILEHEPDVKEIEKMLQVETEYTEQEYEIDNLPTMYIKQTLRSGQVVNYEGNIVIIGDSHPGSEINATGDITVWGILSGIAHAGASGNDKARIRALKINAIQLRISDCYSRRPDTARSVFVEKNNNVTPEEARIIDGSIILFKLNDSLN